MSLLAAETDFALDILRQTPAESIVYSPLSIAVSLSVLYSGAENRTKAEIGNAILKGASADAVESNYGVAAKALESVLGARVCIATRLFLEKNFTIKTTYKDNIAKYYHADAVNIDFSEKSKAAEEISNFIKNTTNESIHHLIDAANISPLTQALLVNAIYFKSKWKNHFSIVRDRDFFPTKTTSRQVAMLLFLYGPRWFPYAENNRLRVVTMPYEAEGFEFAVFLPKQRHELASFRDEISGVEIQDLLFNATSRPVFMSMPKFHIETQLDLGEILQKLGIKTAFTDQADFSPITDTNILVSKIIHKAVITVDREGTEAGAVTEVEILEGCALIPDRVEFHADKPFLYAVLYNKRPLFVGHYL